MPQRKKKNTGQTLKKPDELPKNLEELIKTDFAYLVQISTRIAQISDRCLNGKQEQNDVRFFRLLKEEALDKMNMATLKIKQRYEELENFSEKKRLKNSILQYLQPIIQIYFDLPLSSTGADDADFIIEKIAKRIEDSKYYYGLFVKELFTPLKLLFNLKINSEYRRFLRGIILKNEDISKSIKEMALRVIRKMETSFKSIPEVSCQEIMKSKMDSNNIEALKSMEEFARVKLLLDLLQNLDREKFDVVPVGSGTYREFAWEVSGRTKYKIMNNLYHFFKEIMKETAHKLINEYDSKGQTEGALAQVSRIFQLLFGHCIVVNSLIPGLSKETHIKNDEIILDSSNFVFNEESFQKKYKNYDSTATNLLFRELILHRFVSTEMVVELFEAHDRQSRQILEFYFYFINIDCLKNYKRPETFQEFKNWTETVFYEIFQGVFRKSKGTSKDILEFQKSFIPSLMGTYWEWGHPQKGIFSGNLSKRFLLDCMDFALLKMIREDHVFTEAKSNKSVKVSLQFVINSVVKHIREVFIGANQRTFAEEDVKEMLSQIIAFLNVLRDYEYFLKIYESYIIELVCNFQTHELLSNEIFLHNLSLNYSGSASLTKCIGLIRESVKQLSEMDTENFVYTYIDSNSSKMLSKKEISFKGRLLVIAQNSISNESEFLPLLNLPFELHNLLTEVEYKYALVSKKVRLWRAQCEVRFNPPNQPASAFKLLDLNMIHLSILSVFMKNERCAIPKKDLLFFCILKKEQAEKAKEKFLLHLESLIEAKILVETESHLVKVNENYSPLPKHKMRKIRIQVGKKQTPVSTEKQDDQEYEKRKKNIYECGLIRIMKGRKTAMMSELILEVIQHITSRGAFQPNNREIRMTIEDLIKRDFFERDEKKPQIIIYKP